MKNYHCSPEIILRTPMKSFMELINNNFSFDTLREKLQNDLNFKEALLISSPALYHEFFENFDQKEEEDKKKLSLSILKYYIRVCTRATPFGTFSGLSVVNLEDKTNVQREELSSKQSKIYLDFSFSIALVKNLMGEDQVRKNSTFIKNSSLSFLNDKVYYIERNNSAFEKSEINTSIYLEKLLQKSSTYTSYADLRHVLMELNEDFEIEQVEDFIDSLIDNQVLLSVLEPSLEETNHLTRILETVSPCADHFLTDSLNQKITILSKIEELFQHYESNHSDQDNLAILISLNELFNEIGIPDQRNYFQIDTAYPTKNGTVDKEIIKDIRNVIQLFYKINNFKKPLNHVFDEFKRKFRNRYDRKEVPLLEALDTDIGIGLRMFDSYDDSFPMLDKLKLSNLSLSNKLEVIWTEFDTYIFNKYIQVIENHSFELEIKDEELKDFEKIIPNPTDSFFAILYFLKPTAGYKYYFQFFGRNSPNRVLGRLSALHTDSQNLSERIDENAKRFNCEYLVAEINHLPADPSMGNVLRKQSKFDYEITYLSKRNDRQQIDPSDLYVSVQNNTILLRSKSLNKYVLPRLSSAHSFGVNTTPLYHFLAGMDDQDSTTSLHFKWGSYKNNYKFHPRVVYKNYIIKLAYWFLKKDDIDVLKRKDLNEIDAWRKANRMPRYVRLAEGDKHLFVDLENELFVELLADEIKNSDLITLEEFLYDQDTNVVKTAEGQPLANEFIFSFLNEKDTRSLQYTNPLAEAGETYFPGEKWLYLKFFVGPQFSDTVLCQMIKPAVDKFRAAGRIKNCFYIRYHENGENHIRLRLELTNPIDNILSAFYKEAESFIQQKLIWKITVDTYVPEYERYGGVALLALSESIFDLETQIILETIDPEDTDHDRVIFATRVLASYLKVFELNENQKKRVFEDMKDWFDHEFQVSKEAKKILAKNYIDLLPELKAVLIEEQETLTFSTEQRKNFETALRELSPQIIALMGEDEDRLMMHLRNHFHMFINRLFPGKQREFELLIAHILFRYYKSEKYLILQHEK